MKYILLNNKKILKMGAIALLAVSCLIIISFFNTSTKISLSQAKLLSDKKIFSSHEMPKFRIVFGENKQAFLIKNAFATEEPIIEANFKRTNDKDSIIKAQVSKENPQTYAISFENTSSFKPGKYTLSTLVKTSEGEKELTQDFTWGVLALNPDKAVYKEGETANISIGVLDDDGKMVCDADVKLQIRDSNGNTIEKNTSNETIKRHKECESYDFTLSPDYSTKVKLDSIGEYHLTLTATTKNGTHSIEDMIRVLENEIFEVTRTSATRIYPINKYPMTMDIKANEDYKGFVEEMVPSSFAIIETRQDKKETDYAARIIEKGDKRILRWNVDFKKGESYKLSYVFDAPDISPEFYLLGNLKITNGFTEGRYWQIANDAVGTVRPDGDVTGTFATCTTNGNGSCRFGVIDEATEITGDLLRTGTAGTTGDEEENTFTSVAGSAATVTNVDVKFQADSVACNGTICDDLTVRIFIDGAYETGQTITLTATDTLYTLSFPGTWTGDDDLQVEFVRTVSGTGAAGSRDDDVRLYQVYAEVTYTAIDVSGNVYNAGTSTALTECDTDSGTHELSLRANGVTYTTSCSSTDGSYTFTGVISPAAGGGMVAWIDDAQAPETDGSIAIRYDGAGNSASNTFYDDTVTVMSDDTNGVDILDMDTFDNADDGDIPYTATDAATDTLVTNSGYEFLILKKTGVANGSMVFDATGTVTTNATGGDIHVDDNGLAELDTATNTIGRDVIIDTGSTLRINGSTIVGGGDITATGTLTTTTGTPTVTIRGTGSISGAGTKTIYNLTVGDGTVASTTLSDTTTVNNDVSVGTGSTFNVNATLTVSGGDFTTTTTGVVNTTSGTPTVTIAGTGSVGAGSGGSFTVYNLTVDGTQTLTSTVTVNNDVTVNTADSLALSNQDLNISGGDLTVSGTGTVTCSSCSTNTVTISGTGNISGASGSVTVFNLTINGAQTLAGPVIANNDITILTGATLALGSQNLTVSGGDLNTITTGTITCAGCSGGTVTMSGTGNLGGGSGAITFYNLTTSGTGITTFSGGGTNSVLNNVSVGAGTTLNINSTISITGSMTNTTSGVIGTTSGTPTVTISGASIGGGTTGAITFYNLVKAGAGTTTFSGAGTNTINTNLSVSAGTFTLSNALTVTSDVTVSSGATINVNGNLNVNGGDFTTTSTGIIDTTAGTPTVTMSGTGSLGGGSGAISFYNLATTGTGTTTFLGTGTNTVDNNVTVGASTTLNINSTISITGSLINTTTGIINYTANSPIVTVSGSSIGGGSGDITFYRLQKAGAGTTTFSGNGINTIRDTLAATAGTFTLSTTNVITVTRDVSASNSATLNQNAALTINGGDLITSGTGIVDTTSGTGSVTINGTGNIGGGGAVTVYNLLLNGAHTLASATTSDTDISIANTASLALGNQNLTVSGGDLTTTGTGTITCAGCSGGTATITGTGNIGGGNGSITFYNLTIGGTQTLQTSITASNDVSVSSGATFALNNLNVIVNGGDFTTTSTGSITCSGCSTSIVTMSGTGNLGGGSGAITFYNLTTTGTGTTSFSGSGTNTIQNDVTVGTGTTLNINENLAINGGDLTTSGTGIVDTTAGTGTVTISGTGNIGGGGTVTVYNLTISGTQTLASTTTTDNDVSVSSGATLALGNQNLTVTGGDLTTTSTGSITCSGCSTSTVTVNGSAATGIGGGSGSITFYNLTIGGTIPIASAITVNNDLTSNGTTSGSSNVTVIGAIAGTGTINMSNGTFEQRVSADENFGTTSGSNAWTFSTLLFSNGSGTNRTITTQTGGSGSITVSTLLQLGKAGDTNATLLNAGNRTWSLSGTSGTPFNVVSPSSSSSFTASTSTMSYLGANGSGNTTIEDVDYNNLTLNASDTFVPEASPLDVNGDLNVTSGTLSMSTSDLNVGSSLVANSGDIIVGGTLTQSSSATTTIKSSTGGAASVGGGGTLTFYNLLFGPTVGSAPTFTLGTAGSQTITVDGTLTIGDGSGLLVVTGISNNPTLDINGSLSISTNGTFTAPASITIAEDFTNNGTFNNSSGNLIFDTASTSTFNGAGSPAITFFNLSSSIPGKTLEFTSGKTFRFDGAFTTAGSSGNLMHIHSTIPSSQWFINLQGTASLTFTHVHDMGCDGSSTQVTLATNSSDGGNNGTCVLATIGKAIKGTTKIKGNVRFK